MQFVVLFVLAVTVGVTVKGFDQFDTTNDNNPDQEPSLDRAKRNIGAGFSVFDALRGKDSKSPKSGGSNGFRLEDMLAPAAKPTKKPRDGFSLEDALGPAHLPPAVEPKCQMMAAKMEEISKKQDQELRLLAHLISKMTK